jgi:histidinol phosphatase-like PHP family hydrolase
MAKFDLAELKKLQQEFGRKRIPFVDGHTHTISKYTKSFDLDKEPPIEGPSLEVVEFASKFGFEEVAITDHSYEIVFHPQMEERTKLQLCYGEKTFEQYLGYLARVKQKYPNIKVVGGIELKVRSIEDLDYFVTLPFSRLDVILIETMLKKPDFRELRRRLGKNTRLILAHPDPCYNFGSSFSRAKIEEWVSAMVENDIGFDINRQFLDKFLSDEPVYAQFFEIAKAKGLKFTLGSDYHGRLQDYVKFFTKTLRVIEKYNLSEGCFLRP